MDDKPIVSIGLMVYNTASFLPATIESILSQSEQRFELIISDDASTDGASDVCRSFTSKDKRIRYFRQDHNLGLPGNFNFVLKQAIGDYFMWAGGDDLWDRDFIKDLLNLLLTHEGSVLAMSEFDNFQGDRVYPVPMRVFNNNSSVYESARRHIRTGDIICLWGLYVFDVLKATGGLHADSRLCRKHSDYLTVLKVLMKGRAVFSQRVLFHKRDSGLCHAKYELLRELRIDRRVIDKTMFYFSLPVFYLYDLAFSFAIIGKADAFSTFQKMILIGDSLLAYLRWNFRFIGEIAWGVWCVLCGVGRKVFAAFRLIK